MVDHEFTLRQILSELGVQHGRDGMPLYNGAVREALERFVHNAGAKRQGCLGLGGALFGHAFAPRYSTTDEAPAMPHAPFGHWVSTADASAVPMQRSESIYHGDVCARCGLTVNVPPQPRAAGGRDLVHGIDPETTHDPKMAASRAAL